MIQFFKEFWLGLSSFWRAFQFIREHRLYWYFLIPAGLMLLIYYLGNFILHYNVDADISNMNGIVWYFIHAAINISIAILLMKFSKYIVVITLSPLFAYISQKCEKIVTGKAYTTDFKQIVLDVKRGVRLAVRNMLWEYSFFLIILLIAWIGWDNPLKSPLFYLTFIVGFYYYGFSFIDYNNERRKLNEQDSIKYVRSHRGLAMGIGMVYSFLILVPVDLEVLFSISKITELGIDHFFNVLFHVFLWICASIAPILAIVGASIIEITSRETDDSVIKNSLESSE